MRRWVRATINAVLVATLVRPMLRRLVARKRQEAIRYAEATIVIPAHELLESVLPPQLTSAALGPPPAAGSEADTGRDLMRPALILGVAAVLAASVSTIAIVLWRRRSRGRSEPVAARQAVAVPIEPERAPAEVVAPGLPAEETAAARQRHPAGSAAR